MQNSMHLFLDSWMRGGHMMDMGRGLWFFPAGFVGLLSLVALILLVIWAIRSRSTNRQLPAAAGAGVHAWNSGSPAAAQPTPTPTVKTPLDVLQMRYAKGEISRAEYDTIRGDILRDRRGDPPVAPATAEVVEASEVEVATVPTSSTDDEAKPEVS